MHHFKILLAISLAAVIAAAVEPNEQSVTESGRAWMTEITAAWKKEAVEGQQQVWGSVRADRKTRRVEIAAIGTGPAENGLLEFLLVSEHGKAYEAVAVTTAKPSDVSEALVYIGMPVGQPIDYSQFRFWPKGERVRISIQPVGDDGVAGTELPLSAVIRDSKAGSALDTFVFVAKQSKDAEGLSSADHSGEIASLFSSPFTVLDVPEQTPQGERYGSISAAGHNALRHGGRLKIVLTPEYGPDKRRVREMSLRVSPAAQAGDLRFELSEAGQPPRELPLPAFLEQMQQLITAGHDPYLAIQFAPELALTRAADFSRMLDLAAARSLLRLEATPGEPYYQALLPDQQWRDREKRPAQPLEIHARQVGDDWQGTLIRPEFERADDGWKVKTTSAPFASVAALLETMKDDRQNEALFYYLPDTTTYGAFKSLYDRFKDRWRTQYVFLDAAAP